MRLQLAIGNDEKIKLLLIGGAKRIDQVKWKDKNSLSCLLLFKIDQILRWNKVGVDKISGFEIMSDVPEKWTSYRIAKITFKALAIAKKYSV